MTSVSFQDCAGPSCSISSGGSDGSSAGLRAAFAPDAGESARLLGELREINFVIIVVGFGRASVALSGCADFLRRINGGARFLVVFFRHGTPALKKRTASAAVDVELRTGVERFLRREVQKSESSPRRFETIGQMIRLMRPLLACAALKPFIRPMP